MCVEPQKRAAGMPRIPEVHDLIAHAGECNCDYVNSLSEVVGLVLMLV